MKKPGQLTAMISSTALDLPVHRKEAIDACLSESIFPIGMEYLPARDATGIKASLEMVAYADIYIGIYAWRYGWVPESDNPTRISITEMEFNYALERKQKGELKEILIFVMHDKHPICAEDKEDGEEAQRKLREFKIRASSGRVHLQFMSKEELRGQIIQSLSSFKRLLLDLPNEMPDDPLNGSSNDPIPKPPAFYAEPHYIVSQEFVGRGPQLEVLNEWVKPSDLHSILLFEAIGGNGKSMLTWEWISKHATIERPDLAGRFWYSFYEKGAVMTDFCQRALAYITGRPLKTFQGIKTPELSERLLHYLQARPWLFVLDGLERVLVAYHRIDASEIPDEEVNIPTDKIAHRDPFASIRPEDDDLLRALACATPSKLLISSRLMPRVLLNKANQPIPSVLPINLPGLYPPDAEKLLKSFHISGNSQAIQDYLKTNCDCHPLVIGILAGLINDYLPDRGNFDAWAADQCGGNQLNLASLDLIQKRNHILKAGLAALPEKSHQFLSTLALLSESADYQMLCAFNPHLPQEPEKVEEPTKPENSRRWDWMSEQERTEVRNKYEVDLKLHKDYKYSIKAYVESPEFLAAQNELDKTVIDLVQRGLLQYDGRVKRYDLHPVVRGVASGGLQAAERDRYGQKVVDYFSHQSHNPFEQAESFEDLRSGLEVVRTLLKMGNYEKAYYAFHFDLARSLVFNFEASYIILSLLRPFFPKGWAIAPLGIRSSDQVSYLYIQTARALKRLGELKECLDVLVVDLALNIKERELWAVRIDLIEIYEVLRDQNRLAAAERCNLLSLQFEELEKDNDLFFRERIDRLELLSTIGKWEDSEDIWKILDPMGRNWWRAVNRSRLADQVYAQFHFWKGDMEEDHFSKAELLAKKDKNYTAIRLLHTLRGKWRIENNQWALAAESLHEAVRMARAIGISDADAEAHLVLAKFHLDECSDPKYEVEQLSLSPKPSHLVIAKLWLSIGNLELAKKHGLAAYKWAWADGEPYVHRFELNKATELLIQLNIAIPELPIYDAKNEESLPWEADIASAIAKHLADNETNKGEIPNRADTHEDDSIIDKFSFGKVILTKDFCLTVLEYDFTTDTDKQFEYFVTPETEFGNIEKLSDLKEGDDIVVDYFQSFEKRYITTLIKEESKL